MSKRPFVASLVAACYLAMAAPQTSNDSPGVTVTLNGASLLHRTAVLYPPDAMRAGVQGTVELQVKIDSTGVVSDAQVLSGPEQLRKPALESVLNWHFAQQISGTTRVIQVGFELPKATALAPSPASQIIINEPGTVRSLRVSGLSEQLTAELLSRLQIHEGDAWNTETAQKVSQAVKAFDEHLSLRLTSTKTVEGGTPAFDLEINSMPSRIRVGGNVQSAMIVNKVPPIYPAAAKAAGVQGVVHLSAIIGGDGTVQELTVLDGPQELIEAATDAVKKWVYKPTLLNGNPVQVQTTIDINFTLNR